ncbi:MAG: hypothetical protein FJ095_18545 [Deltaproteobacteria bacterium]|nr:hypothetical protein [Deltaproteobacteria bacterium]
MSLRTLTVAASLALAACSSSSGPGPTEPTPEPLAPPENGVQFASGEVLLAPGEEAYRCFEFALPEGAGFPLVGIETQATHPAVHHFGVFTTTLTKSDEPYSCEEMGAAWGLVSGGGVGTPAMTFPAGTAMTIDAGAHVVLQLHLLNASSKDATVPPVRLNLETAKDPSGLAAVGLLITGTLKIDLPPKAMGVVQTGGCDVEEPLENVFAAFPHMHRLGRSLETRVVPKDGAASRTLSQVTWDFSDQGIYAADGSAKLGERVETSCTYDNSTDAAVSFGLHTKDEMCVNVLYYYPAKERSRYCGIP